MDEPSTAEFLALMRTFLSVSIGQEAEMVHPAEMRAASIASHPAVSLLANTKRPTPDGLESVP